MMPCFESVLSRAFVAVAGLSLAFAVHAQQDVRFNNSTESPVQLRSNSTVVVDQNWNVQAECVLDAGKTTCRDFPKNGIAPGLVFSGSATANPVIAGSTDVSLSWNLGAAAVCKRISTPGHSAWTGLVELPSGAGSVGPFKIPTSPATSPWVFEMVCYSDNGSTALDGRDLASFTVEQPPQPADECTLSKDAISDPVQRHLFQPEGLTVHELTWSQLFPNKPDHTIPEFRAVRNYPYSYGDKIAVGSKTFTQASLGGGELEMRGRYLSIPFIADSTGYHELSYRAATSALDWPLAADGNYQPVKPANSVYWTISPCRGDFRTTASTTAPVGDETFTRACRKNFFVEGAIFYGPETQCKVVPGKRYYINIVFADPDDGVIGATETTCQVQVGTFCDAGIQHDNPPPQ